MPELLRIALFAGGVMGALFLLGVLFYYPRARRWNRKAVSEGQAVCKDCGHKGPLSYGFMTGVRVTSANLRLVCEKCTSENWYVPGGKNDAPPAPEGAGKSSPKQPPG